LGEPPEAGESSRGTGPPANGLLVYSGFSFCKKIEVVNPASAQEFQQGNDFENDR
jgi:hypothetical protein